VSEGNWKLSLRPISQAFWAVIDGQMRIPG